MSGTLYSLIEASYVDSVSKSIKGKLAWKVNPYVFVSGDKKYQRKKSLGRYKYDEIIKDFLRFIEKEKSISRT